MQNCPPSSNDSHTTARTAGTHHGNIDQGESSIEVALLWLERRESGRSLSARTTGRVAGHGAFHNLLKVTSCQLGMHLDVNRGEVHTRQSS